MLAQYFSSRESETLQKHGETIARRTTKVYIAKTLKVRLTPPPSAPPPPPPLSRSHLQTPGIAHLRPQPEGLSFSAFPERETRYTFAASHTHASFPKKYISGKWRRMPTPPIGGLAIVVYVACVTTFVGGGGIDIHQVLSHNSRIYRRQCQIRIFHMWIFLADFSLYLGSCETRKKKG